LWDSSNDLVNDELMAPIFFVWFCGLAIIIFHREGAMRAIFFFVLFAPLCADFYLGAVTNLISHFGILAQYF